MKYGILSDIHSNLEALDACLASLQKEGVDDHLFLGDAVGYYSQPNETIQRLRSIRCWKSVMGNHDAACLDRLALTAFNPPAADAILWTKNKLDRESWSYLQSLRMREEIGDITLVHASPFQSERWHYLTQEDDLAHNFRYFQGSSASSAMCTVPSRSNSYPTAPADSLRGTLGPWTKIVVTS
jgi:hypothetical protein